MKVWQVEAESVYRRGTGGVFTTLKQAEAAVGLLQSNSDGFHYWTISEHDLDAVTDPDCLWQRSSDGFTSAPAEIVYKTPEIFTNALREE